MVKCPLDESQALGHSWVTHVKDVRAMFMHPTTPKRNHGAAIVPAGFQMADERFRFLLAPTSSDHSRKHTGGRSG